MTDCDGTTFPLANFRTGVMGVSATGWKWYVDLKMLIVDGEGTENACDDNDDDGEGKEDACHGDEGAICTGSSQAGDG